jgi:hypothetical protein
VKVDSIARHQQKTCRTPDRFLDRRFFFIPCQLRRAVPVPEHSPKVDRRVPPSILLGAGYPQKKRASCSLVETKLLGRGCQQEFLTHLPARLQSHPVDVVDDPSVSVPVNVGGKGQLVGGAFYDVH